MVRCHYSQLAINSRNILRKILGWQSLMRNYFVMHVSLKFKLENVSRTGSVQWKKCTYRIFSNFTYFKGRTCKIIFHIRVL
jgi:hypothetical protein